MGVELDAAAVVQSTKYASPAAGNGTPAAVNLSQDSTVSVALSDSEGMLTVPIAGVGLEVGDGVGVGGTAVGVELDEAADEAVAGVLDEPQSTRGSAATVMSAPSAADSFIASGS